MSLYHCRYMPMVEPLSSYITAQGADLDPKIPTLKEKLKTMKNVSNNSTYRKIM